MSRKTQANEGLALNSCKDTCLVTLQELPETIEPLRRCEQPGPGATLQTLASSSTAIVSAASFCPNQPLSYLGDDQLAKHGIHGLKGLGSFIGDMLPELLAKCHGDDFCKVFRFDECLSFRSVLHEMLLDGYRAAHCDHDCTFSVLTALDREK